MRLETFRHFFSRHRHQEQGLKKAHLIDEIGPKTKKIYLDPYAGPRLASDFLSDNGYSGTGRKVFPEDFASHLLKQDKPKVYVRERSSNAWKEVPLVDIEVSNKSPKEFQKEILPTKNYPRELSRFFFEEGFYVPSEEEQVCRFAKIKVGDLMSKAYSNGHFVSIEEITGEIERAGFSLCFGVSGFNVLSQSDKFGKDQIQALASPTKDSRDVYLIKPAHVYPLATRCNPTSCVLTTKDSVVVRVGCPQREKK